ncbi:uncharacterized protein LOC126737620 [Anthonomus grandis grandis]|uniref:uncharacterized protein LOC126737620 n=1 Tax=Anthonomus grandis grandis TaxID=2921223 RepID=UPI002165611D|nr:uncharacterized protein LOC126737620 [Anthonomus grandis grandis]
MTSPSISVVRSRSGSFSQKSKALTPNRSPSVGISLYSRMSLDTHITETDNPISNSTTQPPNGASVSDETQDILGHNPEKDKKPQFILHKAVEPVWTNILTSGLPKEDLDKIYSKYDLPQNGLFSPPKINPELQPSMNNLYMMRDQTHTNYQLGLSRVLSALGGSINSLLEGSSDIPKPVRDKILTCVADSGRMVCNIFHDMSQKRRQLIMPLMNKQIKNAIEKTPPGEFLFGPNLAEKIQAVKSMEKIGRDIRPINEPSSFRVKTLPPFSSFKRKAGGGDKPYSTTSGASKLNWRRPFHQNQRREMRTQQGRSSFPKKAPVPSKRR